jgi:hypothetical protein
MVAAVALAAGCSIVPTPAPVGPAPVPGAIVVPPDEMTLNVSNGSALTVSLVVNGTVIEPLGPGEGHFEIPAARLPPLPWSVEIRSQSGRRLLSAVVRAGDVWRLQAADGITQEKGAGGRIDLSAAGSTSGPGRRSWGRCRAPDRRATARRSRPFRRPRRPRFGGPSGRRGRGRSSAIVLCTLHNLYAFDAAR